MDIGTLRNNLAITGGQVVITASTVTDEPIYDAFFQNIMGGTPITITNAQPGPKDSGDTVQITGTPSAYLNVANASIVTTFVLDPTTGNVTAELCYQLPLDGTGTGTND
ncbi:MAG: hypothetical protein GKS03_17625 [Alphaproteobacteria bacterium]|nr:hypothetical protein [Alphaproteobacteria bacterium]